MENLFHDKGLVCPVWLTKAATNATLRNLSGKQARFFVYRAIWSRLQKNGMVKKGETVIYPDELTEALRRIFPDDNEHKIMGRPTVSLELIAKIE